MKSMDTTGIPKCEDCGAAEILRRGRGRPVHRGDTEEAVTSLTCTVCPRQCELAEQQVGFCNVRQNINGENVDPLFGCLYPNPENHNPPGSYTAVLPGCSLQCPFCLVPFVSTGFNGDVSQWPGGAYRNLTPHEFVERVKKSAGLIAADSNAD